MRFCCRPGGGKKRHILYDFNIFIFFIFFIFFAKFKKHYLTEILEEKSLPSRRRQKATHPIGFIYFFTTFWSPSSCPSPPPSPSPSPSLSHAIRLSQYTSTSLLIHVCFTFSYVSHIRSLHSHTRLAKNLLLSHFVA